MNPNAPNLAEASRAIIAAFPGRGSVRVEKVAGRSVVTRALARSPLHLLTPRKTPGNAAWVYTSTFGGGLVARDTIELDLSVGDGASCVLMTQASTKIYASPDRRPTRQSLNVTIEPGGFCGMLPDPLTCYAGAAFEQRITIGAAENASLALVDWLTSGRRARGERWAFEKYSSRVEISVADRLLFRDAVLLDQADGPIAGAHRMGRFDCMALAVLIGPRMAAASARILAWAAEQPIRPDADLIFSASPVAGGIVLRAAGLQTQTVGRWIQDRLADIPTAIGADPWARKW